MQIERNVQIGWRADSRLFFVNDNAGSNIADCEIFRPFERHPLISSLMEAVGRNTTIVSANEQDIFKSHVYVSCIRWLSKNNVLATIYGHYDYKPATPFKDRHFTYNLASRKAQPLQ